VAVATPAYDVILTAGNKMFTITGTDSISGPLPVTNNPNFTIADSALMTWKQSVLGKLIIFS